MEVTEGLPINTNGLLYVRKTRLSLPLECEDPSMMIARFEVSSAKVVSSSDPTDKKKPEFVLYKILVRMSGVDERDLPLAFVERRYNDLLNLYENLRKDFSTVLQKVVFPKKRIIGNFSDDVLMERAQAFEEFLDFIITVSALRESPFFLEFIQGEDLRQACLLLDERRHEQAIPILENCFRMLNKIYLDKSRQVLLILCRLVAACTSSPVVYPNAEQWVSLALRRFEHVSDVEVLVLYVPLLQSSISYYRQKGEDCSVLESRLEHMGKKGIKVKDNLNLMQLLHVMDPRSETA